MKRTWLSALVDAMDRGPVVRAVVITAEGSCPRGVGAAMTVTADGAIGTIGGGALEFDAIVRARDLLRFDADQPWLRYQHRFHLGPDLNQCCGGAVTVLFERFGALERSGLAALASNGVTSVARPVVTGGPMQGAGALARACIQAGDHGGKWFVELVVERRTPVAVYGAGHVGRAVVRALAELPFAITWIDVSTDRFPSDVSAGVTTVVAVAPETVVANVADRAFHLVMTHSHSLDEAVVASVLRRGGYEYLGLIGSATKRVRFRQRLARAGFGTSDLDKMISPIGLEAIRGKEPEVIAASVAADLLLRRQLAHQLQIDQDGLVD